MKCSICKSPILSGEITKVCDNCGNEFHLDCWNENGGCGITGCINLPSAKEKTSTNSKICPACKEKIDLEEIICPFCNERFDTIAPVTTDELRNSSKSSKNKPVIEERKGAIAVLIFGILGFTAPLNLIIGGIWYIQKRKILKETSPMHNILSIVGLSISVFYSIIIFIGLVTV